MEAGAFRLHNNQDVLICVVLLSSVLFCFVLACCVSGFAVQCWLCFVVFRCVLCCHICGSLLSTILFIHSVAMMFCSDRLWFVLFCVVLCWSALVRFMVSSSVLFCYAVLFCDSVAVLLCAVRCCSVLFSSVLSCAGWFCAVIFFAALRCYVCLGSVLSCALLFCPVLCCALLFYAAMCSCVLCCSCSCLSFYSDLVLCCSVFVCCVLVLSVQLDVVQFCEHSDNPRRMCDHVTRPSSTRSCSIRSRSGFGDSTSTGMRHT